MTVIDTPPFPGIIRPVFNILDYGADYTGARDSAPAIQAAINAAIAAFPGPSAGAIPGGAIVFCPPGKFLLGSTLIIDGNSGIMVEGAGTGATALQLMNSRNVDMIRFQGTVTQGFFCGARNLQLDGNKANNTSGNGINVTAGATTPSDLIFELVYISKCAESGFKFSTSTFTPVLRDCLSESNTLYGIDANINGMEILGGKYLSNTQHGILLQGGAGIKRARIIGANITGNLNRSLWFRVAQVIVADCHIENAAGASDDLIVLDGAGGDYDVHDNVLVGLQAGRNAVTITSSATNVLLHDNTIIGTFNTPAIVNAGLGNIHIYGNIGADKGFGLAPILGIDNRSGVTVADGSPIVLYAVPAGANQLFDAAIEIDATAFTSGTATYTMTYTENGVSQTIVVTATVINVVTGVRRLIQPDASTNVTVQLTGAFVATCRLSAALMQLA